MSWTQQKPYSQSTSLPVYSMAESTETTVFTFPQLGDFNSESWKTDMKMLCYEKAVGGTFLEQQIPALKKHPIKTNWHMNSENEGPKPRSTCELDKNNKS
ncbi:hypothetical protein AVEN_196522-1 [Araneus ventricosus]|uniref:Uncharacterized protein n=1 Tax=Araneus ventricosus TaxID=182803 RepID=A0A4Y2WGA6_ARAVE|nr:hypothetical protein AVEN_121001-1 [Araneus ventricosus]GBO36051.1 hypothetical protein AVEN_196522-1 [Araneus ventricosus]